MPRPLHYDLDELRAAWESDRFSTTTEVMEYLGIDGQYQRSVQANIRKFYGRRPRQAAASMRQDWLKRSVINHLVETFNLRRDYCSQCQTYCGTDVYVRQLSPLTDKLESVVIVGKCCKRAGDF